MKTESNVRPVSPYKIEANSDKSDILFFDNVEEVEKEEETFYSYDLYIISVPTSADLSARVEANYSDWLSLAKEQEEAALKDKYDNRVKQLIRGTYSIDDEIGIEREKEAKPDKFEEHYRFVEECQAIAYQEVYGNN